MPKAQKFRSNGKLLISGEYVVMDGAKALAIPTKTGQTMEVLEQEGLNPTIFWMAFNHDESLWFETEIDYRNLNTSKLCEEAKTLLRIFSSASVHHALRNNENPFTINTYLEFNKEWGLGTSSTLINNIAQWLKINPYHLQFEIFGGSGYDIACASESQPLIYQWINDEPRIELTDLKPEIKEYLYFIHLGKKQNSREAIAHYNKKKPTSRQIETITHITEQLSKANSINEFESLIKKHNTILSEILNQASAQEQFPDCPYTLKYLGAWGGDFMMAVGNYNVKNYFKEIGFKEIFEYSEMFAT